MRNDRDIDNFNRKLMKFWIQSFLLGVPRIVVGLRNHNGILTRIDEIRTENIPDTIAKRPNPSWNANMCVNFAAVFLECESPTTFPRVGFYEFNANTTQGWLRPSTTMGCGGS